MPFLYQTFYNFRNIKNDTIDLSNREVYFVGENGQGKSNILESLYYASYGISFRTHIDSQIIKNGEKNFSINSLYKKSENDTQKVTVIYENGKKRIEKNGKKGAYIQRYKGLGEMNPDQLWETTMNPENRRLLKIDVKDMQSASDIFELFMGDEVEPRREYIQAHAKDVKHLDV